MRFLESLGIGQRVWQIYFLLLDYFLFNSFMTEVAII